MAGDKTNQLPPSIMAETRATSHVKPHLVDLVDLFQRRYLWNEINQILQCHKTCHSDQVFTPYMKSLILDPYFISPPPIPLKLLYPQPKDYPLPFK